MRYILKKGKNNKKYEIQPDDGKSVSFGDKRYEDYTTHKDDERKKRYIARHKKNEKWDCNATNTAGFWSKNLLWNKKTLKESARDIEKKCNIKIKGAGVINKAIQLYLNHQREIKYKNPLSRKLEQGEYHYKDHNWTGPGTKAVLHPNSPAINNIDNCSKIHDFAYVDAEKIKDKKKRNKQIQKADKEALLCYADYPNEDGYDWATAGIGSKFLIEKTISNLIGKPFTFYG